MSVNFPSNRGDIGLPAGPLQPGDTFRYNSIEYTWVLSGDGSTGLWSAKGINVDPNNYIAKTDTFDGDVSGTYKAIDVGNALSADEAKKTQGTLTFNFVDAEGNVTSNTFNGFEDKTFAFADTVGGTNVFTLEGTAPVTTTTTVNGTTAIGVNNTVPVVQSTAASTQSTSNHLVRKVGNQSQQVRVAKADQTSGTLIITQGGTQKGTFNGTSTTINLDSGGSTNPGNVINVLEQPGNNFSTQLQNAFNAVTDTRFCVYVPPGNYMLTSSVTLNDLETGRQVSFYSDAFGSAKITTNGHTIRFSQPTNVQNLNFNTENTVVGLLFKRTWDDHDEDMDSSIHNCDFNCSNQFNEHVAVQYWGRNLKFTNNRMKTGKNSRAGLQLLYYTPGGSPEISTTKGFRRTCISNNTFHSFEGSNGVLVGGSVSGPAASNPISNVPLMGLVFCNNTIDFEGTLFVTTYPLQGGTFTGNSCFWGNCPNHGGTEQYIFIGNGNGVVITGNSFDGDSRMESGTPDQAVSIASGSNNIIANNSEINF